MRMVRQSAVVSVRGQPDLGTGGSTFRIPDPTHPPTPLNWLDGTHRTPEHCFGQAGGKLSNRGTLRLVGGFDRFSGHLPNPPLNCRTNVELLKLQSILGVRIQWGSSNETTHHLGQRP